MPHPWHTVAELLAAHYGSLPPAPPHYRWTTLVGLILDGKASTRRAKKAPSHDPPPLTEFPSASEVAAATPDKFAAVLESLGCKSTDAAVLVALARWWVREPLREAEDAFPWQGSIERLREELRAIRGVSLSLADRILLEVGGRCAFPIDRPTQRVAYRHGWLDPTCDYDEWRVFCTQTNEGATDSPAALWQLSHHLVRVGREHCGPRPKCDGCPLQLLLPAGGAVEIEG